jgi:hypothetical protein
MSLAQGDFAVCGQRQGLLALDLGSIFDKIAAPKNSYNRVRFHEHYPPSLVGRAIVKMKDV